LLDTGTRVSLLGKGGRELVETLNVPVQKYLSVVRTIFWERPATHKIDLTERAKVFKDRPYPMSPANRRILALGPDMEKIGSA